MAMVQPAFSCWLLDMAQRKLKPIEERDPYAALVLAKFDELGSSKMSESIPQIFDRIMSGTITREEVDAAHERVKQTSREVHESFRRVDERQAAWGALAVANSMTKDEMIGAYERGNVSIYADHDKGFTLD